MLAPDDQTAIIAQMGRLPADVTDVAARCPAGHPCVVTTYPLRRRGRRVSPFPTYYWLTCRRLCKQIAHLERDGAIATIAAELAADPALQAQLLHDHADYIARRWAALSEEDRLLIAQHNLTAHFQSRGIGGMTNPAAIKCLHLHVAHHLAAANAIGERVMSRYNLKRCSPE